LVEQLVAAGHEVLRNFDMRSCYCKNGRVFTLDGFDISSLDILYYMNADEQNAHQLDMLGAIERSGVRVINNVRAHLLAKDKFVANQILRAAGVAVPDAILIPPMLTCGVLTALIGHWPGYVVKRRFGHGGLGVQLFDGIEQLYDFIKSTDDVFGSYYIERSINFGLLDNRVEILNGEYLGGYRRRRNHRFKTNVHARAEMVAQEPSAQVIAVAARAAAVLGIEATIVDIVEDTENGNLPLVLEVNPMLGVFTKAGLLAGVNTVQGPEDIHPIFSYDDRKIVELVKLINQEAVSLANRRNQEQKAREITPC
jgi:ribosomal protein S6--L-glutamate ligase